MEAIAERERLVRTARQMDGFLRVVGSAFVALFVAVVPAMAQQAAVTSAAGEVVLAVDPAASKLHWTVDTTLHSVHGTFAVKKGTFRLVPRSGHAEGEVVIAASSGQSGNHSRDARMHKEILETAKYPDASFRPTEIDGKLDPSGSSNVKLHGVVSLHGSEHEITAEVHAEISGDHWKGTANFAIPYVAWGIKDPSNFFLKVKHTVNVELSLAGTIAPETKAAQN